MTWPAVNSFLVVAFLIGAFTGAFVVFLIKSSKNTLLKNLLKKSEEENQILQNKYLASEKQLASLSTEKTHLEKLQTQLEEKFKHLSQSVLMDNSKKFQESAKENIKNLLDPFKQNIESLNKKIKEQGEERSSLKEHLKVQIENLSKVNKSLEQETKNLSQTMKGSVKAQGIWGEMVLQKVLDSAGLKENEHYTLQGKGLNLKTDEGKRLQPDVIINLPENKHIVVDAKVSLTHYEQFTQAESDQDKTHHLNKFIESLKNHVQNLSQKQYYTAEGLNTPDFTLMFFPIEGAFSLALQKDPHLFQFSWDKSIIIVSPTTLFSTSKTIASIWRREKQMKNANAIALSAGKLYDKCYGFVRDMEDIGNHLKKADDSWSQALNKLSTGSGNIISRLDKIKQMGARAQKEIPDRLLSIEK